MARDLHFHIPKPDIALPQFSGGSYGSEEELLNALRIFNDRHGLPQSLSVHIYETDATTLGIGRKHLGTIDVGSVLAAGEVDVENARR